MNIPERIKHLRTVLGTPDKALTQPELGKLAGTSKQSVSNWEGSIDTPGRDSLLTLQKNTGVNPNWVLCNSDEMFLPEFVEGGQNKPRIPPKSLEVLKLFERLNKPQQTAVISLIKSFLARPS